MVPNNLVTQMFFDNQKYFDFVDRCRAAGITVPIIPGVKPIHLMSQLTVLRRFFRSDIPEDLARECASALRMTKPRKWAWNGALPSVRS
jgi:5,10-methylenetetrahydrofolate reductase